MSALKLFQKISLDMTLTTSDHPFPRIHLQEFQEYDRIPEIQNIFKTDNALKYIEI